MSKWLTGSAKTGEKIINNQSLFSSNFIKTDNELYTFSWEFGVQHGYASIRVKDGKISLSSLLDTDSDSPHDFGRPLGLYNDSTLLNVFNGMMHSVGITTTGVYSEL